MVVKEVHLQPCLRNAYDGRKFRVLIGIPIMTMDLTMYISFETQRMVSILTSSILVMLDMSGHHTPLN